MACIPVLSSVLSQHFAINSTNVSLWFVICNNCCQIMCVHIMLGSCHQYFLSKNFKFDIYRHDSSWPQWNIALFESKRSPNSLMMSCLCPPPHFVPFIYSSHRSFIVFVRSVLVFELCFLCFRPLLVLPPRSVWLQPLPARMMFSCLCLDVSQGMSLYVPSASSVRLAASLRLAYIAFSLCGVSSCLHLHDSSELYVASFVVCMPPYFTSEPAVEFS